MKGIVSIIYGVILAFLMLGMVAFFIQGFSENTLGLGFIFLSILFWIGVVWWIYPIIYEKRSRERSS